jgi:hypothetical protein
MVDSTRRDALARVVSSRLHACSHDELRVLDVVLTRLERGRDHYGPLDLSQKRDWARESAEELVDENFYRACKLLSERDEQLARIEIGLDEIADAPAVIPPPAVNFTWDMTDVEDVG